MLEITVGQRSVTKRNMIEPNFDSIILILNLAAQLDNDSLFYGNIHIPSQNAHCLSFGKTFAAKLYYKKKRFPSSTFTAILAM